MLLALLEWVAGQMGACRLDVDARRTLGENLWEAYE